MSSVRSRTSAGRRRVLAGGAALALVLPLALSVDAAAKTRPTFPLSSNARIAPGSGQYVTVHRACGIPTDGRWACLAEVVAPATRTTPGAIRVATPNVANGPANGLTPAELASAYRYIRTAGATSQTVAIIDGGDDPHVRADLNHYDAHFHFPKETATSFRVVNQAGKTKPLPAPDRDGAVEITLDVQAVRAVCGNCKILLVEANETADGFLSPTNLGRAVDEAVKLGATEVSNSYGGPEDPHWSAATLRSIEAHYTHPGVVITASTGDDGWYDWDFANLGVDPPAAPNVPAALPSVVAVGGTQLSLTASGTRAAETVWNENGVDDSVGGVHAVNAGATGGGCSRLIPAPSWQVKVTNYATLGCGTKRQAGDVAADADPSSGLAIYDSFPPAGQTSGWIRVGGTSLSAPMIAAMWALAGGARGVRYPAQSLYGHFKYAKSSLYDVVPTPAMNPLHGTPTSTAGGNGFCGGDTVANCSEFLSNFDLPPNPNVFDDANVDCSYGPQASSPAVTDNRQCVAAPGYDGPSGVGTPSGLSAFKPLISIYMPPHRPHAKKQYLYTVYRYTDLSKSKAASYHWSFGDGRSATTLGPRLHHTYAKPGRYTLTVTATDIHGYTGTSRTTVVVSKPLKK